MEKATQFFKTFGRWFVYTPLAIITSYNVIRQEIDSSLPPFIDILSKLHWAVWLSILLVLIILDLALQLYKKESKPAEGKNGDAYENTKIDKGVFAPRNQGEIKIINEIEKNSPPNILVGIIHNDITTFEKIKFQLKPLPQKPDIDQIIFEQRASFSDVKPEPDLFASNAIADYFVEMSREQYPSRIESYLKKYRDYEIEKYNFSILGDRYHLLPVIIECESTQPSSNVIIELSFPEEIHFPPTDIDILRDKVERYRYLDDEYIPKHPTMPSIFDFMREENAWMTSSLVPSDYRDNEIDRSNEYEIIKKNNVNLIVYRIRELIQNRPYTELTPISVWFDNIEKSKNFIIPVKIYANQLPKPVEKYIEIEIIVN